MRTKLQTAVLIVVLLLTGFFVADAGSAHAEPPPDDVVSILAQNYQPPSDKTFESGENAWEISVQNQGFELRWTAPNGASGIQPMDCRILDFHVNSGYSKLMLVSQCGVRSFTMTQSVVSLDEEWGIEGVIFYQAYSYSNSGDAKVYCAAGSPVPTAQGAFNMALNGYVTTPGSNINIHGRCSDELPRNHELVEDYTNVFGYYLNQRLPVEESAEVTNECGFISNQEMAEGTALEINECYTFARHDGNNYEIEFDQGNGSWRISDGTESWWLIRGAENLPISFNESWNSGTGETITTISYLQEDIDLTGEPTEDPIQDEDTESGIIIPDLSNCADLDVGYSWTAIDYTYEGCWIYERGGDREFFSLWIEQSYDNGQIVQITVYFKRTMTGEISSLSYNLVEGRNAGQQGSLPLAWQWNENQLWFMHY